MAEITVIMPSCNVVNYIDQCLESVVKQTFRDMEILVIDAESEDGTLEIIKKYINGDQRVRLISSKRKSYGYQVNLGMDKAQGKYIAVVETDDYIAEDMLETLYKIADKTDADFVKGNHDDVVLLPDGQLWSCTVGALDYDRKIYHRIITPRNYPELFRRDIYFWKGLYRKKFLDEKRIRMNETDGAAYQDAGFLFQTLSLADKVVYLNHSVYRYRRANEGASVYNPRGFHYLSEEYAFIERKINAASEEAYKDIEPYYYARLFDQCAGRTRTMAAQGCYWDGIAEAVGAVQSRLLEGYENGKLNSSIAGDPLWKEIVMFLNNPEEYFAYQMYIYNGKRRILKDLIKKLEKYPHVVIYSCGRLAQFALCLLEKKRINITAFCENDMIKWNTKYLGKDILSVEDAVSQYADAVFVIANHHYSPEMKKQLLCLGVSEKDICFFGLEYDLLLLNL